ncbi:MAG: hypothetical protein BWY31_04664 [Lentisphaerae bacterium ADurb.Bin242]|nr:MAG: hypothetical protein BWY31_04664 [Lentisphaerae bacterium ADurb.Bin242]
MRPASGHAGTRNRRLGNIAEHKLSGAAETLVIGDPFHHVRFQPGAVDGKRFTEDVGTSRLAGNARRIFRKRMEPRSHVYRLRLPRRHVKRVFHELGNGMFLCRRIELPPDDIHTGRVEPAQCTQDMPPAAVGILSGLILPAEMSAREQSVFPAPDPDRIKKPFHEQLRPDVIEIDPCAGRVFRFAVLRPLEQNRKIILHGISLAFLEFTSKIIGPGQVSDTASRRDGFVHERESDRVPKMPACDFPEGFVRKRNEFFRRAGRQQVRITGADI